MGARGSFPNKKKKKKFCSVLFFPPLIHCIFSVSQLSLAFSYSNPIFLSRTWQICVFSFTVSLSGFQLQRGKLIHSCNFFYFSIFFCFVNLLCLYIKCKSEYLMLFLNFKFCFYLCNLKRLGINCPISTFSSFCFFLRSLDIGLFFFF
jgi:hypothetical protein